MHMTNSSRYVLFSVFWLLWLALLPGTFVGAIVTGNSAWSRFWWISSAVLATVAWINALWRRRDPFGLPSALIASGVTLGMLADLYGAFRALRFTHPLTMIVPLFALGHVAYIAGLLTLARRLQLTRQPRWTPALAVAVTVYNLAGLALWTLLVHPSDDLPAMHLPTAAYTLFLATAAALMAALARLDRRFLPVALGGLLFLISDAFLALRLFQDNWRGLGDLCWITYGIAQMLIVYGAAAATSSAPARS